MTDPAYRFLNRANALTYGSLVCGLLAMSLPAEDAGWQIAGLLIVASVVADTYDGRFARRYHRSPSERRFGIELDSLADAVAFGVVPVVCLFRLSRFASPLDLWVLIPAAGFYSIAALTRLGCYNLEAGDRSDFVGLPTTLAGLLCGTLFLVSPPPLVSALVLAACGVAMISPFSVARPRRAGLVVLHTWLGLVFGLHALLLYRTLVE
jgi:CDP-diacylglycerol--serine O-phosphatidyltransferase